MRAVVGTSILIFLMVSLTSCFVIEYFLVSEDSCTEYRIIHSDEYARDVCDWSTSNCGQVGI